MQRIHDAQELRTIAVEQAGDAVPCRCTVGPCAGWESVDEAQWPAAQMTPLGTLRDPDIVEPTFEERHVGGSRYASAQAPVAPAYFPYNRCDLWRCGPCQRLLLRYTEFGGYYVDHRVRALNTDLVVD